MRSFQKSIAFQSKIHKLIPGGAHTYAKGDDQYPEFCPPYLVKGKGCKVWDIDNNEFIEYGMGMRAVSLGHDFPEITEAAYKQMKLGINYARPAVIEYEAASEVLSLIPGADMIKFTKNGSDATTAAVKIARAVTRKNKVAICADHPFFSTDDWFIGATKIDSGIPQGVKDMTVSFKFNNLESAQSLIDKYPGEISCFILEPEKYHPVDPKFLQGLRDICDQTGALLIFDEMITGFHWSLGGYQTELGVVPDLSTFGKAMGNGHAVSALVGKRAFMELGGLHHNKERVFLLSTTHGAENHGLAACIAVIKSYKQYNVIEHLRNVGERLRRGMKKLIEENKVEGYVDIIGHPSCLVFTTKDQNLQPSQQFRTLFLQEMVQHGVICPNLVVSLSHTPEIIDQTLEIIDACLGKYRKALTDGIEHHLIGRSVAPVYRKRNFPPTLQLV